MKTLIVVSGGDAPGINTVIARFTGLAQRRGDTVIGSTGGFAGVLAEQFKVLDLPLLRLLEGNGGTLLASSREPVLSASDAEHRLKTIVDRHEIDNLLLFGGDGTLKHVLPLLQRWEIPAIALPTTIDNDVAGTERTLGFDSACNFAYTVVEGILATAHALPGRIFMVETLGGDTGFLALDVAYASGSHAVLLPEYEFAWDWLAQRLKSSIAQDGFSLVILSEGVKAIPQLQRMIPELTGIRLRYSRLGHAQRGGAVSHVDRRLASEMAQIAHHAFHDGATTGAVVVKDGITRFLGDTIGSTTKPDPDRQLYDFVNGL